MIWLHRFASFVAASTLLLVAAGGLVTSTGSGLAVPDWPNTYGYFMFTFPLSKMVGGIFYEHGHRLIASSVGFFTIILAAWIWKADPRRWVRRIGVIALGAVVLQGTLGGITVLYFLPAPVSIGHAGLAQLFFCLTVCLALSTSPGWLAGYPTSPNGATPADDLTLRRIAAATVAIIYLQILVGATMRHSGAGLAIPDFPLAFGRVLPPTWSWPIAVHFAHRVGAVIATLAILATTGHVLFHHRARRELTRPSLLLIVLVIAQFTLGALTVLTEKQVGINTAHVAAGALVLATTVVLTLRINRARFADAVARPASAVPAAAPGVHALPAPLPGARR